MDLSNALAALHTLATRDLPANVPTDVPALAAETLADLTAVDREESVNVETLRERVAALLASKAWPAQASGLMACTVSARVPVCAAHTTRGVTYFFFQLHATHMQCGCCAHGHHLPFGKGELASSPPGRPRSQDCAAHHIRTLNST